ncbi:single-stranded-DNA-specific exonuclease [Gemmatirosa kalamazoonensis]|uniref:Single-stranded-DNA-specific exonuclease n=1 Tax=Gemmatirosa kalamazoonensis TaxID=861299 RepID=W0RJN9_9BACT|nr:single-stranded-DNA-specific exonuclease [Gemmatirosa kalamazoonensis]
MKLAARPRFVGEDGLRLRFDTTTGPADAIGWGLASRAPLLEGVERVDVAYRLERDEYRGESRLQARLLDVAPAAKA